MNGRLLCNALRNKYADDQFILIWKLYIPIMNICMIPMVLKILRYWKKYSYYISIYFMIFDFFYVNKSTLITWNLKSLYVNRVSLHEPSWGFKFLNNIMEQFFLKLI